MKILHKFKNGNVNISLFDNGTKIQEWPDDEIPYYEFPLSMDIKITNMCDLGCPFCHEKSIINGEHGDLVYLINILKDLPKGTELAIGGGNPLENPLLIPFLQECRDLGFVSNMTINAKHLFYKKDLLNVFIKCKLIYGLGISIDDDFDFELLKLIENPKNIVLHVIAGVNNINILEKILNKSSIRKVLILGYKDFGRGVIYHSELTNELKIDWYNKIENYIKKLQLSFDNIGINQLSIKRFLTNEEWNLFFQGDDGLNTMYIDAVKKEFAKSSTSEIRYSLEGSIKEIFNIIKSEYIMNG